MLPDAYRGTASVSRNVMPAIDQAIPRLASECTVPRVPLARRPRPSRDVLQAIGNVRTSAVGELLLHDARMGAWGVVGFALLDKPQHEAKGERSHGPHNQRTPLPG